MTLDSVARRHYRMVAELELHRRNGDAFQDWFSTLMEHRFPGGDFVRTRPWGKFGDRKNDGYVKSQRTLCQVYAPNELTLAETLKKIDEDFDGALPYWKDYFGTWVFVHNSFQGLSGDLQKALLDKQAAHPPLVVTHWPPSTLLDFVLELPEERLVDLLGPPVTLRDFQKLGLRDLQPVILAISNRPVPPATSVSEVPPRKIEVNGLSEGTVTLLKAGWPKAPLVKSFFDTHADAELGDRVGAALNEEYRNLKAAGSCPDEIFMALVEHAGGLRRADPLRETAVYAVIAYFFEQCDIFERPRLSGGIP